MYAKDIQDSDDPEGLPECVDDSVQQTVGNVVSSTLIGTTSKMALAFVAIFVVTRTHFILRVQITYFVLAKLRECATDIIF